MVVAIVAIFCCYIGLNWNNLFFNDFLKDSIFYKLNLKELRSVTEEVGHRLATFWCSDQYLSILVRKLLYGINKILVIILEKKTVRNEDLIKFAE